MKITLEVSDETFRQYAIRSEQTTAGRDANTQAMMTLAHMAKLEVLKELRTEVSCDARVVKASFTYDGDK